MTHPLIYVRGLRYRYPDGTLALEGIDFELQRGESVALLGANGSGKTTFALHLNGLLMGDGVVEIAGKAVAADPQTLAYIRSKVGLLFQNADDQLFLPTVLEDVMFGPTNLGMTPTEARAAALQGLADAGVSGILDRAPDHLSAGEKRRVALAGVLAMQPEILVLDEPTTSLDPPGQRDLVDLLHRLPQAKVLITHDVAFAQALATRAVFFEKGHVVGEGPVEEIVRRFHWSHGVTRGVGIEP